MKEKEEQCKKVEKKNVRQEKKKMGGKEEEENYEEENEKGKDEKILRKEREQRDKERRNHVDVVKGISWSRTDDDGDGGDVDDVGARNVGDEAHQNAENRVRDANDRNEPLCLLLLPKLRRKKLQSATQCCLLPQAKKRRFHTD